MEAKIPYLLGLKEGDHNTRYFHSRASHRQRRNALSAVRLDSSELSTDPRLIRTQFMNYYKELFTTTPLEDVDVVLGGIEPSVMDEMNLRLTCPFSEHEIDTAMKQMAALKALRPDGMPPVFYQSY